MRQRHCTITPKVVRLLARESLQRSLSWQDYGKLVTVAKLLDVLLLAAALCSSLSAVVKRFLFGFSHETARKAIAANLPCQEELTNGLLDALHDIGSRNLRRRLWNIAIDTHLSPFYGELDTPHIVGGKKKQGTKYFYGYATAVLIHHRHRYTVGLVALTGGEKPHEMVAALLAQMESRGLKLSGCVLDAGFDSGDVMLLLQDRKLSYTIPLQRKGKGTKGRNACWEYDCGTVCAVEWTTDKTRRQVSTQAVVLQGRKSKAKKAADKKAKASDNKPAAKKGKDKEREQKKVYAFGGWQADKARSMIRRGRLAKRWYRKRFGIETSYRQMNEAKAKTTKKDVVYRLLLVGLAMLLRQLWVYLTAQVAHDRRLRPTQWVAEFRLALMNDWLADLLKRKYKEEKVIRLNNPLLPLGTP